jgi:hypothetical protein
MLDTEVDPLFNVAISDDLVNDDADCSRGDVVDDARSAVVVLVWLFPPSVPIQKGKD